MGRFRIDFDWDINTLLRRWRTPFDENEVKKIEKELDNILIQNTEYNEEYSLYGFINLKGEQAIPIKYSCASDFHEGFLLIGGFAINE